MKQNKPESIFTDAIIKKPNHNVFNMSHGHMTTGVMGKIIPIDVQECLPNDTWSVQTNSMIRFLPMVAPVMQDVTVNLYHFFVPSRIMWKGFEDMIRGPRKQNDVAAEIPPFMSSELMNSLGFMGESKLANYLGVPTTIGAAELPENENILALPFIAYQRIWWDYFRDQNLQNPDGEFPEFDGQVQNSANTTYLNTQRYAAWKHDYFTSMLPFAQKGEPVPIPIIGEGPVVLDNYDTYQTYTSSDGDASSPGIPTVVYDGITGDSTLNDNVANQPMFLDPNGTLKAIINNISTTIKDLRTAEALQKFLEKNARSGNRYFEYLKTIFGQSSPDSRLQRAEYIGGSEHYMAMTEVLQTSETSVDSPQGNMSGHGVAVGQGLTSTYHCEEHGYMMTLFVARPRGVYFQGLPKMFSRFERFDWALPDFAQIGEQEVKGKELYTEADAAYRNSVLGYVPRYAEYKYCNSRISGMMQSDYMPWHLARKFDNPPLLNESFIECKPSTRIFPVVDPELLGDYILMDIVFNMTVARVLPRFDIPSLV